ncbi:MAG: SPFH domain-containing protein [Spirochaetes bacterium]|nr:SPFH domain-containing protein [Spirochaetota bacterium]MBU1082353.1 SPFH domain-containing protein [Spirochaetota bacterium]
MGSDTVAPSGAFGETERTPRHANGLAILALNVLAMIGSTVLFIACVVAMDGGNETPLRVAGAVGGLVYLCLVGPVLFAGIKVLKPNEAQVFTLFGKYHGCLREPGIFFVNPFVAAVQPSSVADLSSASSAEKVAAGVRAGAPAGGKSVPKTVSLKAMTLNNDRQKINDSLGNPIVIGIVVIWKVVNPTKAVFNVDNFGEYLSIQCDSALRNIVRLYPYDLPDEEGETSLRGSSQEVALRLKEEIQEKAEVAGIEILEARITHLSYAPEIAAAMLQRQQASAVIAARQMIVEGAVGMVEMALAKLSANNIVDLDEERKATMVSNLLVVLCSNKDVQPVVNSGSIY